MFTLLVSREPFVARAVCFLIGALAMTFGSGFLFLALMDDAGVAGSGSHVLSASLDIAIGAMLLGVAELVRRRPPDRSGARVAENRRVLRLMRSPALAVVLGAAMYLPSPLYLGALKIVADAGLSPTRELVWVAGITLIVTSMIEIPVLWMVRDPARGRTVLAGVNRWMRRNGRAVGRWMLLVAGAYLVLRGVFRL